MKETVNSQLKNAKNESKIIDLQMSSAKVVSDKDALAFITKKLKTRNNMYDNL